MASGGISGVAVALATAGGVLMYAGFQGLGPLEALRDITKGKPKPLKEGQTSFANDPTKVGQGGGGGNWLDRWKQLNQSGYGGAGHPEFVAAAMRHRNEKYSQARRWEEGYSDCSSFVGKALKDCGITPPGLSVTGSYLTWRKLKTVSRAEIVAGDLLCGPGHIAIAIDGAQAIGQQNGRHNVRVDTHESIMTGQPSWVPRRYVGGGSGGGTGGGPGGGSGGGTAQV